MGDNYTIADMAAFPGCATSSASMGGELVRFSDFRAWRQPLSGSWRARQWHVRC
jgi:hypothetical protein